jgi:hypothetical protein
LDHVEAFWNQIEFVATVLLYAQSGLFVAENFKLVSLRSAYWV